MHIYCLFIFLDVLKTTPAETPFIFWSKHHTDALPCEEVINSQKG